MKVFVVIFVYLKRFKTFADLFDSVGKSLVLVEKILSMYGVLLLMWAGVFIALLGGNVTDQTQEYLKTKYQVTVSEGDLMYNFNDYLYGVVTMFMISQRGWGRNVQMTLLGSDDKRYNRIYLIFLYVAWAIVNRIMLNILFSFFMSIATTNYEEFSKKEAQDMVKLGDVDFSLSKGDSLSGGGSEELDDMIEGEKRLEDELIHERKRERGSTLHPSARPEIEEGIELTRGADYTVSEPRNDVS
jgi:hypothetical protein